MAQGAQRGDFRFWPCFMWPLYFWACWYSMISQPHLLLPCLLCHDGVHHSLELWARMNPLSPEWFVDILVQKPEKMLKPCASVYNCLVQAGGLESEDLCAHSEPVHGVIYPTESVVPGRIFPWLSSLSGLFALATDNMRRDQENQTRLQTPEGLSRCRPVLEWEMLLEEVWVSPSPCLLLLSTDRHTVEKVVARCFPIQTIKHQAL